MSTDNEIDPIEQSILDQEKRYNMTRYEVQAILKEHAPGAARYFDDSYDNMDAWESEGKLETFAAVMFDMATWFKHGGDK